MGVRRAGMRWLLPALFLVALVSNDAAVHGAFNRYSFPEGFLFGTGSAAYQYEGAVNEGGRGPSIWDTYAHIPGKVEDGSNGDVAVDFYHRYKEDLNFVTDMNMDAFRFSIAWSRILPNGTISGGINKEGIAFYNSLIDEVIARGLKPFVTIFHFDTPQALEDKYRSFLSENIVKDFVDYADVCFREFGDRVKSWNTFNEPMIFCAGGYGSGTKAPGRCSPYVSKKCAPGDSGSEPYVAGHNLLLAHAEAVRLYRQKYQRCRRRRRARSGSRRCRTGSCPTATPPPTSTPSGAASTSCTDAEEQMMRLYTGRFGLIYVDRETLKRYRKKSSYWFADFLKRW